MEIPVISVETKDLIGCQGEMRAALNTKKSNDRYKAFSMADALKMEYIILQRIH